MGKLNTRLKIISAIFLGLFISIYITQNHKEFKKLVEEEFKLKVFSKFTYSFNSSIKTLQIFFPRIQFKDLKVSNSNFENWNLKTNNLNISYSWIEFLINKKLQLSAKIDKLNIFSLITDGKISLFEDIKNILLRPKFIVPIIIKNLAVKNCKFKLQDSVTGVEGFIKSNIDLKEHAEEFKSNIFFKDGKINLNQFEFIKNVTGTIQLDIPKKNIGPKLNANLSFQIPTTTPKDCFLSGKLCNGQGDFTLRTLDDELTVSPITITTSKKGIDFSAQGQMPIGYLENLFFGAAALDVSGDCQFSTYANINKETSLHGHIIIKDFIINKLKTKIEEVKFFFKRKQKRCKYNFSLETPGKLDLTGSATWDEKLKQGTMHLENSNGLKIDIKFSKHNMFGSYYYNILIGGKPTLAEGKIIANKKMLKIIGLFGDMQTELYIGLKPKLFLKKAILRTPKGKIVEINTTQTSSGQSISAHLELFELKKLLPDQISNLIFGKGAVIIAGNLIDNIFTGTIEIKDGNLIILNSYNIIKSLKANFTCNLKSKSLSVANASIQLDKGTITSSNAIIELNDKNEIDFAHVPILINNCFLFWNNMFGTVSGKLLINKQAEAGNISGKIVLNDTKIRNNVFSSEFSNKSFNINNLNSWNLSLILKSKSPIKIKTPMLYCLAKLDLKANGNIAKPSIEGQINLLEGKIFFPYKPLNIVNGNILFIQGAQLDPIIELTAKAKLKNYAVSMFVTGSATNSQIQLASVPDLTEEQIGCLLLAGSENASLNIIVPTLIMQNIKNIVFGSAQAQEKLNKYFKAILNPLKHIRFVPTFVDETGRGGFRGGIEIDVSDRLHALIQKNFSMPEDTKFEVDYQVTDDLSLRAIKDERGDLGGEVEMRWKF